MPRPEVVVVTGASAGVGRAVVRRFARDGARIALLARGIDGLEAAGRDVEMRNGSSAQLWATTHRALALTAIAGAGALPAYGLLTARRNRITGADLACRPLNPGPGPEERAELRALLEHAGE